MRFRPKVRLPPAGSADEPDHDQRHRERARVGQHVRRVGEQGERVREDADDDLGRHEARDQRECDRQPARVRVGANLEVRVPVARVRMRLVPVPGVLAAVIVLSSTHSSRPSSSPSLPAPQARRSRAPRPGSAHHQPSSAFASRPTSSAIER